VALESREPRAWFFFFLFPRVVLRAPPRGGRKVSRSVGVSELVRARIDNWDALKAEPLPDPVSPSRLSPSVERRAVSALREGDVRKALRQLVSAPLAPTSDDTFGRLRSLHPSSSLPPPSVPSALPPAPHFSEDLVRLALQSFPPSSAAGLFGYRPSLLLQCVGAQSFAFLRTLTRFVNVLASGSAPSFLQPFLAGGVSLALLKPSGGVRPLCCGDPVRRLVANFAWGVAPRSLRCFGVRILE
jgi:hypothetical protein